MSGWFRNTLKAVTNQTQDPEEYLPLQRLLSVSWPGSNKYLLQ